MNEIIAKETKIEESETSELLLGADRNFFRLAKTLKASPLIPSTIKDAGSIFLIIKTAQLYNLDYLLALQNAYLINGKLTFSSHFLWSRAV